MEVVVERVVGMEVVVERVVGREVEVVEKRVVESWEEVWTLGSISGAYICG